MWRMDKPWRGVRASTPWVERHPSEYLEDHVRFCAQRAEGAALDRAALPRRPARLTLYGSRYPYWDCLTPAEAQAGLDEPDAERLMAEGLAFLGSRMAACL
jgi:hypothetical protein